MWRYLYTALFVLVLVFSTPTVYAQSQYVLPYPSAMPGSFGYRIDQVKENLYSFLFFGNFSQFAFKLSMSDKYLVEAKTLFEYKQYLLAYQALLKSDYYFRRAIPNLLSAKRHGKNVKDKELILRSASQKHIEVLEKIEQEVPENFLWAPEKGEPTRLNIKKSIKDSIETRKLGLHE